MADSMSPADVAAMSGGGMGGLGSFGGVIGLLAVLGMIGNGNLFGGNRGGNSDALTAAILASGNNGFANAIGYNNLATQNDVQRGFDTLGLQDQSRDILTAVNNGAAQSVAATNNTFHDTLAVMNDKYAELQRDIASLAVGQANALANQNQCCCDTRMLIAETGNGISREIAQTRYEAAMQTAAVNANTTAQTQKILDALTGNRMAEMQNQINALQLREAVAGVVRYPMATTYSSGGNPFCGCNCGSI